jgi:thioredoxin 1
MLWYIVIAIVAIVLFGPALLADKSPIPETSGHVHKITDSKQLNSILKSNDYVITKFSADWCPPCRAIAPIFSQLADQHAADGILAFATVNVDNVRDVAARYGVSAMPTFIPFSNGKPEPLDVDGIKPGRSVIQNGDGRVERILGADVAALKAVVASISRKIESK